MTIPFKKDPIEYSQRQLLSTNVFDLLPEDDDCFVYEDIFSQIDAKSIEEKYSILGQHAYHPKRIVAILIYAYSQGIFSSRQIEKKCSKDLSFMYISHRNCPNFRVLSDFRKDNYEFFLECFRKSVIIASQLGMVSLGHVSLDGSKFYANTSKHKAASYKRLRQTEAKLTKEIEDLLKKADKCDDDEDRIYHERSGYEIPAELKIKEDRLSKIKKAKEALEKREKEANPKKKIKETSQISFTDTEAKIMKYKGSFDYCYNGQISVDKDSQIIVGQHLTQNANDKKEVKPALKDIKKNTGKLPDKMSLDNGYMTADNISALSDAKVDAYIAASRGEKDRPLDSDKKIGKSYFSYSSEKDIFVCPAGHILKLKFSGKKKVYRAESKVCLGCSYQNRCVGKKNDIPKLVTDKKGLLIAAMEQKMKKDSSKEIYKDRKIIVEPVFGQMKTGGFRRFSLRRFLKAGGEFSLVCAVHNFKKIVNKIKAEIEYSKDKELVFVST